MKKERINEKTPNGGDYSEMYYLDKNGDPVDKKKAVRGILRECKKDGTLVKETFVRFGK